MTDKPKHGETGEKPKRGGDSTRKGGSQIPDQRFSARNTGDSPRKPLEKTAHSGPSRIPDTRLSFAKETEQRTTQDTPGKQQGDQASKPNKDQGDRASKPAHNEGDRAIKPEQKQDHPAPKPEKRDEPLRQHSNNLDTLYQEAQVAREELKPWTEQFASILGARAEIPPLKERINAEEKIQGEYKGDTSRILDLARSSIVCDSLEQIETLRNGIESNVQASMPDAKILRSKDSFANPSPTGYRDLKYNIQMPNGHITELQVHHPEMLIAKEKEHPLYEERQAIQRLAKNENRMLTIEEYNRFLELEKKAKEIYSQAWEKTQKGQSREKNENDQM